MTPSSCDTLGLNKLWCEVFAFNDRVVAKDLAIRGVFGVDFHAYEPAVRLIESGKYPLAKMHTHTMPLEEAERALRILAREIEGEDAVHIALVPD